MRKGDLREERERRERARERERGGGGISFCQRHRAGPKTVWVTSMLVISIHPGVPRITTQALEMNPE